MFRRHLRAIVSFAASVLVLVALACVLIYLAESQTVFRLFAALGAPVMVGCALVAVSVVFYFHREAREKAEWSVLASVLAASIVVATHWNNIVGQVIFSPLEPENSVQWVTQIVVNIVFLVGICFLGVALAARWMERHPTTGWPKGLGHEVAAVAILTVLTQGFLEGAHQIAWRAFATPLPDLDAIFSQSAMCRGGVLLGLLAASLFIALVVWRGADRPSRWRLISLFSVWVCMDSWTRDLHWVLPQINPYPYEWTWALAIGVEAGIIAILYAHLVVGSLWRRAFEPTGQASSPLESGLPR